MWANAAATGGTYTLTAFTQTTGAIAYNATAGTVQTALNALTNVANRGNCTVSGDLFSGFQIAFANGAITGNQSLTPAGSLITNTITDGTIGRMQKLVFSSTTALRDVLCLGHGLAVGDVLYVKGGSTYYGGISNFTVPTADTVRLSVLSGDSYAAASTITEIGKRTKANYEPGARVTRCNRITEYYFPGITSGIATASDIDIPQSQADGPSLVLAMLQGSGTLNASVGELTRWKDSPILSLTRTTIHAADV